MGTIAETFKKHVEGLKAADILAIPKGEPERLFPSSDLDDIKDVYRLLASKWHTDRNKSPQAKDVFAHVAGLKEKADEKSRAGLWQKPGELRLNTIDGKTFKVRYLKKRDFELGEMYIAENFVTYMVRKEFSDLFQNGVKAIKELKYANDAMREKTARYLPEIHQVLETPTHHVLTLKKTPDVVLASDLLDHLGGKVPPKHVAWMASRLHNLACYLQWGDMTHNAISPETCFVSPEHHSVLLLGGWWYAAKEGTKILGLPNQTVAYAPRAVLDKGLADRRTDSALLRATCRQLLGDVTGVRLARDAANPKPMVDWLCLPGSGDAVEDYKTWIDRVVIDSFGKREFVRFPVSPRDVYQPPIKGA